MDEENYYGFKASTCFLKRENNDDEEADMLTKEFSFDGLSNFNRKKGCS